MYIFVYVCVYIYSIVLHCMVWYDMAWYGMVWYGMHRIGIALLTTSDNILLLMLAETKSENNINFFSKSENLEKDSPLTKYKV